MAKNIKIKLENTYSYCNERNKYSSGWDRYWYSITSFDFREAQYIYNEKKQRTHFIIDFLRYKSYLKYILKVEESICTKNKFIIICCRIRYSLQCLIPFLIPDVFTINLDHKSKIFISMIKVTVV